VQDAGIPLQLVAIFLYLIVGKTLGIPMVRATLEVNDPANPLFVHKSSVYLDVKYGSVFDGGKRELGTRLRMRREDPAAPRVVDGETQSVKRAPRIFVEGCCGNPAICKRRANRTRLGLKNAVVPFLEALRCDSLEESMNDGADLPGAFAHPLVCDLISSGRRLGFGPGTPLRGSGSRRHLPVGRDAPKSR